MRMNSHPPGAGEGMPAIAAATAVHTSSRESCQHSATACCPRLRTARPHCRQQACIAAQHAKQQRLTDWRQHSRRQGAGSSAGRPRDCGARRWRPARRPTRRPARRPAGHWVDNGRHEPRRSAARLVRSHLRNSGDRPHTHAPQPEHSARQAAVHCAAMGCSCRTSGVPRCPRLTIGGLMGAPGTPVPPPGRGVVGMGMLTALGGMRFCTRTTSTPAAVRQPRPGITNT
jgi:hypothetical protein